MANSTLDCVVCGSCVVDLLCKPVLLSKPISPGVLVEVDPLILTVGGIVSNTGITMARLGMNIAAFSYVGKDAWAPVFRNFFDKEHVDHSHLLEHPTAATSTTVVTIDPSGERSFLHCVGAPKLLDKSTLLTQLDWLTQAKMFLLGYYSLMPNLQGDLPEIFAAIRARGCQTAMDAAGSGGSMKPLDRILPHLDVWVPSLNEARHQTGLTDPEKMIALYRSCGAPGVVGVKLGGQHGVLLSNASGQQFHIPSCPAPGPVVDTTGAGDSFYAGLLTGLLKGLTLEQSGKLGTAAAACCVTSLGGATGGRSYPDTAKLAGV